MPDVLDDIIDKLPQSTLKKILELDTEHSQTTFNLDHLLKETRQIKVKQINGELSRKTFCIKFKTERCRNRLEKLKKAFDEVKNFKKPDNHLESLEAYNSKINELDLQIKNLIRDQGDIDLTELFNDVENFHEEIKDYNKKISEEKSKCEEFIGFPPDLEEGKEAIAKIKESIKKNQMANK